MAYYMSPLVDINEIDLTTAVPAVATSIAVLCLRKTWKGPEMKRQFISTVEELISVFGRPDTNSYEDIMSAMGYLKWGNKLWCTRAMPASATFAGAFFEAGTVGTPTLTVSGFTTDNAFVLQDFDSKDPDEFHDEGLFSSSPLNGDADFSIIANSRGTNGNYTKFAIIDMQEYDIITSSGGGNHDYYVSLGGTLDQTLWNDVKTIDLPIESQKEFIVLVQASTQEQLNDDPIPYEIREAFLVSTNEEKKNDEGKNIFAPNVINTDSKYIRIAFNSNITNLDFYGKTNSYTALEGGQDNFTDWDDAVTGQYIEDSAVIEAINLYENPEIIDVNIFIDSNKGYEVKNRIRAICESRMDCIGLLDCLKTSVLNQTDSETSNLRLYRTVTLNFNSSYVALYGNWLEIFDIYNQRYRWVPPSGYMAGIFAKTDDTNDPWWAPAGLNRAIIGDARRLAWSPTIGSRDILYKNGINPIVSFAGQGKVVWGQKTMLDKSSAFNRINVRRLFIVLEKSISTMAKYFLFEPNDDFSRTSLVNIIEPYLRDIRGRRGIYDFMVVCDERNNTPERIDRQELWCDIYIKPVRSAEFIVLNFVATRTGASFTELVAATTTGL